MQTIWVDLQRWGKSISIFHRLSRWFCPAAKVETDSDLSGLSKFGHYSYYLKWGSPNENNLQLLVGSLELCLSLVVNVYTNLAYKLLRKIMLSLAQGLICMVQNQNLNPSLSDYNCILIKRAQLKNILNRCTDKHTVTFLWLNTDYVLEFFVAFRSKLKNKMFLLAIIPAISLPMLFI